MVTQGDVRAKPGLTRLIRPLETELYLILKSHSGRLARERTQADLVKNDIFVILKHYGVWYGPYHAISSIKMVKIQGPLNHSR